MFGSVFQEYALSQEVSNFPAEQVTVDPTMLVTQSPTAAKMAAVEPSPTRAPGPGLQNLHVQVYSGKLTI